MQQVDRKFRFGVVDDEQPVHERIERNLGPLGEFIFHAYSLEGFKEKLNLIKPGDIIFVDGKLNPLAQGASQGIEIVKLIKEFQPGVIVVWISSLAYPYTEPIQPDLRISKIELHDIGLMLRAFASVLDK